MSAPYTYTGGEGSYHQDQRPGDNAFGAEQEVSMTYPPMPEGYEQYQAPPPPAPGHAGYVAGPEYARLTQLIEQANGALGHQYQQQKLDEASVPISVPQTQQQPPSVFDLDPSAIKRTAYYVPQKVNDGRGDLNVVPSGNEYPVIGHVLTLPFSPDHPTMGVAIDAACCRECNQQQYTGRTVDYSKKKGGHHSSISLTIVEPTAAMSYQDGVSVQIGCVDGELFRPCLCPSFIHRGCFREMRSGLSVLKSRDYYECPHCRFTYKLERIMGGARPDKKRKAGLSGPTSSAAMGESALPFNETEYTWLEELGEGNVRTRFYWKIAFMWSIAIAVMGAVIAILAGASYGLDRDNKRIPVFIKMMLSSLAATYPSSEKRDEWREEFRRPDIAVWQYYLAFAVFLSALLLIAFGLISYLACVDPNDSEIRPSLCAFFCEGDVDRELEIKHYIANRQEKQKGYIVSLPAPVRAAVVQREERRSNEIRDHYYRQRKPSYWFSCADNSSYYYYDSRPYYYKRRKNYYDNRYNGHGRHYHSGGYYAGNDAACCDLCLCCTVWCCSSSSSSSSHHHQHQPLNPAPHEPSSTAPHTNTGGGGSSSSCDCDDCSGCTCGDCSGCDNCGNCHCSSSDCSCSGCDGEGAAAALVVLLVVVLVIIVIVILSAYVTLVCYLVSRTVRLMGVAGKLAYVQALEEEDHVFCLAINESWRPVGTV